MPNYRGKRDIFAITTKKLENLDDGNLLVSQRESPVSKRFQKLNDAKIKTAQHSLLPESSFELP